MNSDGPALDTPGIKGELETRLHQGVDHDLRLRSEPVG